MAKIAKIAVAAAVYAIDRPYDYLVPDELSGLQPGMRVAVPFGAGNRVSDGIVLSCGEDDAPSPKLKPILSRLDEQPMLGPELLQLALWMRERYFCTVYDAARVMLPAGLWFSLQDCWRLAPDIDREAAYDAAGNSAQAKHLVELLFANDGWAELRQIRLAFGTADPSPALNLLQSKGAIVHESSIARKIGDKTEEIARLSVPPEDALVAASSKRRRAPLQCSALETLCATGEVSVKELCYFTGASKATLRALEKAGLISLERREVFRRPEIARVPRAEEIRLNPCQQQAFDGLSRLCAHGKAAAALLYGVTGSGKTLVYIKLIRALIADGKSVIVLVPEIALTPQLMERFVSHFGEQVALLHSGLSAGERYDEWKRVRTGQARVVVGTRSAVFAPAQNLGAIIMDEEQEPSYKSEQNPRYHARDVAKYRCAKHDALLLLGSATPAVETMYHARGGQYHLFELPVRFNAQALPHVEIIDMKQELRQGNGSCISRRLRDELAATIERGEQAILFLNRRGANRMAVCGECGASPSCPRCSAHLTYHSANHRLMCHYCGHSQPLSAAVCSECGGILEFVGIGTQKAESELQALFPHTEILRMDTDTVTATNSHDAILERFSSKRIPILLGTQMIAKGLDFENVTLVGVLSADQSLYAEDYRAGERTFSLLTQVVGRSGRGSKQGRAIIQTCTPGNDVILSAAAQDYGSFYEQELRMRRLRRQPPFSEVLVISASGPEETAVLRGCTLLRDALNRALQQPPYSQWDFQLLGPAPAPVAKINNRYRYRLTMYTQNNREVRQLTAHLLRKAQTDKQNKNVTFFADFDPPD
ncbi:MAG: primosomal protein N' [Oscillospiraceae bacterium]|nr:primosomal protein N' [Oscillospiraceae bacterium]